jgi:hypothetical protein
VRVAKHLDTLEAFETLRKVVAKYKMDFTELRSYKVFRT